MRKTIRTTLKKIFPGTVIYKHYVRPIMRLGQKHVPYDAKYYFDNVYKRGVSDRITVWHRSPIWSIRFHYNAVENSIIEGLIDKMPSNQALSVLDIGSGAGHWIDFYLEVYQASRVVGVDIADPAVSSLREKYQALDTVQIVQGDISQLTFNLKQKFDIINAIGVMFHITDDGLWRQAVRNLANHLNDNGIIIVGGQFGWITQNVQVQQSKSDQVLLVNKRIRSLRNWQNCARQSGLKIIGLQRTKQGSVSTPENHILFLALSH